VSVSFDEAVGKMNFYNDDKPMRNQVCIECEASKNSVISSKNTKIPAPGTVFFQCFEHRHWASRQCRTSFLCAKDFNTAALAMNGVAEPEPRKKFLGLSCITMRLR
jgi:hypothetical protein